MTRKDEVNTMKIRHDALAIAAAQVNTWLANDHTRVNLADLDRMSVVASWAAAVTVTLADSYADYIRHGSGTVPETVTTSPEDVAIPRHCGWREPHVPHDLRRGSQMYRCDGNDVSLYCDRAIDGWQCTRVPGHSGPCAANYVGK